MIKVDELKIGDLVRHVMDIEKGFVYPGVVLDLKTREALVMWSPWEDAQYSSAESVNMGWHNIEHLTIDMSQ